MQEDRAKGSKTQSWVRHTLKNIGKLFNRYQTEIFVVLIMVLAVTLRLIYLQEIPPGVAAAENDVINQIKSLSFAHLWIGDRFHQGAYIYSGFLIGKVFGLNLLNLRAFSALCGTVTVFLTYLFISKWFSKKIAIITAFLFSVSAFHITMSRLILPAIMMPLVLLLLFILLTDAYRSKNIWLFGAAGFVAATGLYTSPAFLMVPVLFATTGIYFFFKNKKFLTAYRQELIIAGLAFVAGAIPYFVSFFNNPGAYLSFYGFNRSFWQIIINISQIPNMLLFNTPVDYVVNLGSEPLLDPFIAVAGVAGILIAVYSSSRRKYFFLLSWLGVMALYATLKTQVTIVDLLGIVPVLYVFAALALDYVIERWFATFPKNKRVQLFAIGLVAIFFALSTLYNYDRYFLGYKNSEQVIKVFSEEPAIPLK